MREGKGLFGWLKANIYVSSGHLFVKSNRGFQILARARGIDYSNHLPGFERVWVSVTPAWWIRSWLIASGELDAVVVRAVFGRFGNQVFQLAHALTVASGTRAKAVLAPGNSVPPPDQSVVVAGKEVDNSRSAVSFLTRRNISAFLTGLISPRAHLVGTFFHTSVLPSALFSAQQRTVAMHRLIEAGLTRSPEGALTSDHLVIHVRGDDAFSARPHRAYGQPPLSFYALVLDDSPGPR